MFQSRIFLFKLVALCIIIQVLQEKSTSQRISCITKPPRLDRSTLTTDVHRMEKVSCCSVTALVLGLWLHSSYGQSTLLSASRRLPRLILPEIVHELIMALVGSQSLIPTLQAPIHMAMKVLGIVGAAQSQQDQQCYQEEKMLPLPREVDKKDRLDGETCRKPV